MYKKNRHVSVNDLHLHGFYMSNIWPLTLTCTTLVITMPRLHILGLRLLILKSTHGSCPLLICSLMIDVIHVLNSALNACLSGRYKITFAGCSSFLQFASMKMTIMLG
jgi:hypothetical protein